MLDPGIMNQEISQTCEQCRNYVRMSTKLLYGSGEGITDFCMNYETPTSQVFTPEEFGAVQNGNAVCVDFQQKGGRW
ncbi:MAG TPA: hypothetical protein VE134_06810 [Methanomicrobiales archaeon]|nr:hypothetical protein [Methanomicrobiales archaeon]